MFDIANPQNRERLLVIAAGIALSVIVIMVLPGQFSELSKLKRQREDLQGKISDLQRHERIKDEVQERMSSLKDKAFPSAVGTPQRNTAMSGYQNWLLGLASSAGLGDDIQIHDGTAAGVRDADNKVIFPKITFTLRGEGRLDQIAEFLRRFHRTDYLHMMTTVSPRPLPRNPNLCIAEFRIEVLVLPTVTTANVPSSERETTAITAAEREMLNTIRTRAILSEYTPPPPPPPTPPPMVETRTPPPPEFYHSPHCFIEGINTVDGTPQCWIRIRTTDKQYFLYEGESFELDGVEATIKKIEVRTRRVHVAAEGGVYTVGLGKPFAHAEVPSYFFTGIVDENGSLWTPDSVGEPYCVIVQRLEFAAGRMRDVARHFLSVGETFPMAEVVATVQKIEPENNQIQMEAAGVVYTITVDGSFSEFAEE